MSLNALKFDIFVHNANVFILRSHLWVTKYFLRMLYVIYKYIITIWSLKENILYI